MIHPLNTKRLLLRPMASTDLEFLLQLFSNPIVHRYEQEPHPQKKDIIEQFDEFLKNMQRLPEDGAIRFIAFNGLGQPIGQVQLQCNWTTTQEWEIGYTFLPTHWRQGYGSEAVAAVLDWAFTELKVHKIMAFIAAENQASVALARKTGMIEEGHMREARKISGKFVDEKVFCLLQADLIKPV